MLMIGVTASDRGHRLRIIHTQRRSHWKFERIPTKFVVHRGKAPHIQKFKTLPDYSPTISSIAFCANLFRSDLLLISELQIREKSKVMLHTIKEINGVINPQMAN